MTTKFAAFLTFAFLNSSATFKFLLIVFAFAGVGVCACCVASSSCNDLTPFVTSFVVAAVVVAEGVFVFFFGVDVAKR